MQITKFGTISYDEESDEFCLNDFEFDAEGVEPFTSESEQGEALTLCVADFLKSNFKYINEEKNDA